MLRFVYVSACEKINRNRKKMPSLQCVACPEFHRDAKDTHRKNVSGDAFIRSRNWRCTECLRLFISRGWPRVAQDLSQAFTLLQKLVQSLAKTFTNITFPVVGTKAFFTTSPHLKLKPAGTYIYFQNLSTMTPFLVRIFIAIIKHHKHKQLGEERDYFILRFRVRASLKEVRTGTEGGQELRQRPCKEECCIWAFSSWLAHPAFSYTPESPI